MIGMTEIIGYLATAVGTCLLMPQVYKTYRTRSVEDLSWGTIILYFLNCSLWLMYGLLIASIPLTLCNSIALVVSVVQIVLKIQYRNNP